MQIVDISLSTHSVTPVFDAVQYDSARQCGFFVEEDISSFDTVEAYFTISTGRVAPVTCDVDDHLVSFILPLNMTRFDGQFNAVITFIDSTGGTQTSAFPFKVNVRKNPRQDGDTYDRAYQDTVAENARAETNNTQMEAYIASYGSITPAQLTSLLSDLQNIKSAFDGQSMTTIGNRLTAMESSISTAESDIDALETLTGSHTSSISTLNDNVSGLTTRMTTAESDIDTLEGLADNAVYHD